MRAGAAEADITPQPGVELAGYASREQPSTHVLDRLFARALWLERDRERLLWLHCDLIGFGTDIADTIRAAAGEAVGVEPRRVMLSATHTHAGPATVALRRCGAIDLGYLARLQRVLVQVARRAAASAEDVSLHISQGACDIGIDRRPPSPQAHVDPTLSVLALRRRDGSHLAVVGNIGIHPVALGAENRGISGDLFGVAVARACERVGDRPIVLLTNGACANVNPRKRSEDLSAAQEMGTLLGDAMAEVIAAAAPAGDGEDALAVAESRPRLPLEAMTPEEVRRRYEGYMAELGGTAARWLIALREWRDDALAALERGDAETSVAVPLQAMRVGAARYLGVGAEVFSRLPGELRPAAGERVDVVGYANGVIGYICPRAIFAEGGYEPDLSARFFGRFGVAPGGHESLREEAAALLQQVQAETW